MQCSTVFLCLFLSTFGVTSTSLAKDLPLSWDREVGFQTLVQSGGDAVYVPANNGYLYALRRDDGMKLWRYYLGESDAEPPVVAKDSVTLVREGKWLVNLSLDKGRENWSYAAAEEITAGPVLSGGLCYLGLKDGSLLAVSRWDGKLKWSFKTGDKVVAPPLVVGKDLYVGSKDKHLYALDARKGELTWKFKSEGIITAGAAADKARVYFSSWDGTVHALDRKTGTAAASNKLKEYCEDLPLLLHGDKLYLYTIENRLLVLATGDLKERASLPIKGLALPPIVRKDEIFIFGSDLVVYDLASLEKKHSYNELSAKAYEAEVKKRKLEARGEFSAGDETAIKGRFPRLAAQITGATFGSEIALVATEQGEIFLLSLPDLAWRWRAEVGAGITTGLLARGETVFVGDSRGYLRALDGFRGGLKWQLGLASPPLALLEGDGLFYAATRGQRLYAIDPDEARVRWYFKSGGDIQEPAFVDGMVVFGASDGKLYLVDVEKGDGRYAPLQLGGAALTAPLVIGRDIVIGVKDVGLRCYTLGTGKVGLKWEHECRNVLAGCLVGNEEVIVYATEKGELALLNASDGSLIWRQGVPKRPAGGLLLLSGKVVYADEDDTLRLYTLVGGKEVWAAKAGAASSLGPVAEGKGLQLLLEDGRLLDYDMNGKLLGEKRVKAGKIRGMLRFGGKLFCAYAEGELAAYELGE